MTLSNVIYDYLHNGGSAEVAALTEELAKNDPEYVQGLLDGGCLNDCLVFAHIILRERVKICTNEPDDQSGAKCLPPACLERGVR